MIKWLVMLIMFFQAAHALGDDARMLEVSRMLDQMALEQQLIEGETRLMESRLRLQEAQNQLKPVGNSAKVLPGLLGMAGSLHAPVASLVLGDGRYWEASHGDVVQGFRLEFAKDAVLAHGCGAVYLLTEETMKVPCP